MDEFINSLCGFKNVDFCESALKQLESETHEFLHETKQKLFRVNNSCCHITSISRQQFNDNSSNNNDNSSAINDVDIDGGDNSQEKESEKDSKISNLENEICQLKRKINQMNEQHLRDTKQYKYFKCKYENEKILCDKYRLCLNSLYDMCCNGPNPRYNVIKMKKPNFSKYSILNGNHILRSEKMFNIRTFIRNNNNCCVNNNVNNNNEINWQITGDKKYSKYFDSIIDYLKINGEYCKNPMILLPPNCHQNDTCSQSQSESPSQQHGNKTKTRGNSKNKKRKTRKRWSKDEWIKIALNECTSVFSIDQHPRISALNGQKGLRSNVNIPANTVIGQYMGIEYTLSEFDNIFYGTNKESLHNIYAFNQIVDVPIEFFDKNESNNENENENNNNENENESDEEYKSIDMVIDGIGFDKNFSLLYVNDCRRDISLYEPSIDDNNWWNIEFVNVNVNGWPSIFLVCKKDVSSYCEFLGYYGESYVAAIKNHDRWNDMQATISHTINQSVLTNVNLNDHFTLE